MGQIDEVVAVVEELLGEAVVGIYLHGSATSGGLKPTSDIDILVLTNRRTTPDERRELIRRLMPISGPGDPTGRARSVGLEVVVQADVRPWRYPPRLELQYGDWWRGEFEGGFAPSQSPNADLALLLEVVMQANRPLFGPPPSEVLDPIPPADLQRAMLDSIPALHLLPRVRPHVDHVIRERSSVWPQHGHDERTVTVSRGVWALEDLAARRPVEHLGRT